ncbi:MAG: sodium:proton antiporter [Bacteroidetes bacterium]|nr:MAG: sodium:proton antiporter [Bacteroidota bacterium]
MEQIKPRGWALIPFIVFVVAYLGIGITLVMQGDPMGFYGFKGPIAVFFGIVVAFAMLKGTINEKFETFVRGCGDSNIITMCLIYLLAGAFSVVSKQMGGVESTVNLGLSIIPANYLAAGLFVICAFLSLATGTSVGTIAAIGPVAVGLAESGGVSLPLMVATLIGGAMFGDNLSIISDTTIAATRTQGVEMRDKFRVNLALAIPTALITVILLLIFGRPDGEAVVTAGDFDLLRVLPYIFVLGAAVAGMNVLLVLLGGIVLSGTIGIAQGTFDALEWSNYAYDGFSGMFEIFLLSMLTGGLAQLVSAAGGMAWLLQRIQSLASNRRSAELGIGLLALVSDAATANNTVAIIIDGPIARGMCEEFRVDPRRSAALLDTFTCVMQGIIPYGAQVLIACSFTAGMVNPVSLLPLSWYPLGLAGILLISIWAGYEGRYIRRHPWKWSDQEG